MWKHLLLIILLVEVFDLSLDNVYHSSKTVLMENVRTVVTEYNLNTSGWFLEGHRVTSHPLEVGNQIQIHQVTLRRFERLGTFFISSYVPEWAGQIANNGCIEWEKNWSSQATKSERQMRRKISNTNYQENQNVSSVLNKLRNDNPNERRLRRDLRLSQLTQFELDIIKRHRCGL